MGLPCIATEGYADIGEGSPVTVYNRRQLGAALRQLRADADETREQTAFVLGCSPTKVTYLESGRNVIGKTELIVLLQHYDAGDKLDALEELRTEAGKRGWWSTARLPEWLAAYVALETEASSVRSFELELIPGLLQTEAYARELHVLRGALEPDDLERRVQARLRRQERLTGSDPLQLSAVVSQAALTRYAQSTVAANSSSSCSNGRSCPTWRSAYCRSRSACIAACRVRLRCSASRTDYSPTPAGRSTPSAATSSMMTQT